MAHRSFVMKLASLRRHRRKGRQTKREKKKSDKNLPCVDVSRFIIMVFFLFFYSFLVFFFFFSFCFFLFSRSQQKGAKLNEVNRFAKKSSRLRYSLYSSRVSIYVRNAPSGIGSIRHCSPTMSD